MSAYPPKADGVDGSLYRIAQELGNNYEALTFEKSVWGLRT